MSTKTSTGELSKLIQYTYMNNIMKIENKKGIIELKITKEK